jgi:hypothetical protein
MSKFLLLLATLIATTSMQAAPTRALSNGVPLSVTLPAQSYSTDLFIELPASAQQFRLSLNGNGSLSDLDLVLREGQPFPDNLSNPEALFEFAHYWSISSESSEYVVVSPQSVRPPRAGRWYIAILNLSGRSENASVRFDIQPVQSKAAQFEVRFDLPCPAGDSDCQCNLAPWNDATVGPNAPGNPGANWGAKRREAVREALRLIGLQFTSESPILVQACWADLGSDSDGRVTLAQAGPSDFMINDPTLFVRNGSSVSRFPTAKFLPEPHTFYSGAPAARLAGTDFCRAAGGSCSNREVLRIEFNSQIDTAAALGSRNFYYGFSGALSGNEPDFLTVAMHELLHGLGFVSLVSISGNAVGSKPFGRDDIYARQLVSTTNGLQRFTQLSNSDRQSALTSEGRLQWTTPETLASTQVPLLAGDVGYRVHTPNPLEQGSTLSHISFAHPGELMQASLSGTNRSLGLAGAMMLPMGWSRAVRLSPVPLSIYSGLWFDAQKAGHGLDIQPINTGTSFEEVVVTFYSYDETGQPEFYLAQGPIVDGVFIPQENAAGNSLVRFIYVNGAPQADSTAGIIRIDFNKAGQSAQCQRPAPPANTELAAATMVIAGRISEWCLQPLIAESAREAPDRSGLWSAASDPGWGLTMAFYRPTPSSTQSALFGVLYYPDGNGQPRWGFVQPEPFASNQTLPVRQINGYCRTCSDNGRPTVEIGTLKLNFEQAAGSGNQIEYDVAYPGTSTLRFKRTAAPLSRLSAPPRRINGS